VFSLAINNTDDHLRNHGFIADGSGWRLSPVFDVNPDPDATRARGTTVFGETAREAAFVALMEGSGFFGLKRDAAERIVSDVAAAVASFAKYANAANIERGEVALLGGVLSRFSADGV
jgi:serine/threonine-protein kinase HipA